MEDERRGRKEEDGGRREEKEESRNLNPTSTLGVERPTFSVWTTLLLLLTYGKDSAAVTTVLRMHCSVMSPCALPLAV